MSVYKIKDLAIEISERVNNPKDSGHDKFVGLEHYDSGNVRIIRYGDASKMQSSAKAILKGDVLIARRNVYLKRAGIVDFDGLTSGDSIVLRAKNEVIRQILPFIFNTDKFWKYASKFSDGSMSKRLSPKILMEYEVNVPDKDADIKELSTLLWSINDTLDSYKDMLRECDELVKGQFVEMFGKLGKKYKNFENKSLGDCCIVNPTRNSNIVDNMKISFVPMTAVTEKGEIDSSNEKEYSEVKKGFTYFEENDVLFAKITPCMENGKGAIATHLINGIGMGSTEFHVMRPIKDISNSYWLYVLTTLNDFRTGAKKVMTGTGGQLRVPADYLKNYRVSLPPIELQDEFAEFYKHIDKSKFVIKEAMNNAQKIFDGILRENLC